MAIHPTRIAAALGLALALAAQAAPDAKLKAAAEAAQPAVIESLRQMVAIESGSQDVAGLMKMADLTEGRLKALAFTGAARWALLPEVPTMAESGISDFVYSGAWHGWLAPARTPKEIIARLQVETQKAMQEPKVREPLIAAGYEPVGGSTEEFRRTIKSDAQKTAEVMRVAGVKRE